MGSKGGHAILQRYECKVKQSDSKKASDSDQDSPKTKPIKRNEREVPPVHIASWGNTSTLNRFNTSSVCIINLAFLWWPTI